MSNVWSIYSLKRHRNIDLENHPFLKDLFELERQGQILYFIAICLLFQVVPLVDFSPVTVHYVQQENFPAFHGT